MSHAAQVAVIFCRQRACDKSAAFGMSPGIRWGRGPLGKVGILVRARGRPRRLPLCYTSTISPLCYTSPISPLTPHGAPLMLSPTPAIVRQSSDHPCPSSLTQIHANKSPRHGRTQWPGVAAAETFGLSINTANLRHCRHGFREILRRPRPTPIRDRTRRSARGRSQCCTITRSGRIPSRVRPVVVVEPAVRMGPIASSGDPTRPRTSLQGDPVWGPGLAWAVL
jgi:hypothetical protein